MRFGFILKISGLILLRSWRATVVLAFMVVSAVASLVFLSSLAVGTNDAMIRNSTELFSGHIIGTDIPRKGDARLLAMAGVERVLIRRQRQFLLWKEDALEPVLLVGIDPVQEREGTALSKKTVRGRYVEAGEEALYLSQDTARRLQVDVGNEVSLGSRLGVPLKTFQVVGIYHTGISHLDQGQAFCPMDAFPGEEGFISTAVFLKPGTSIDNIVAQYRKILPSATFTPWMEFMPDLKQLIDLDDMCMAIVLTLVFSIVSVGISCAFLIFTLKNLREHGIMKAMGVLPIHTASLLVTQIGLLTVSAAAFGTLLGILAVSLFAHTGIDLSDFTSHNQYFVVSGVIYPRLTGTALFAPPLLAVSFGSMAAVWPALYVIRKNPAEILRSV
ncbi:ABC transporter permease [Desulforhabdus sp. TSK]|uniref:ABC transporter permease n=1 Tax=Desulforhabdus sp. TSK TaxID=2925014 RepID=UPI001FC865E0|nr:ABC transporter permease [Desulforhabdus sp. TSK]GKT10227.1 ABC transporter permease [Desulforhabdus sp. TSK]